MNHSRTVADALDAWADVIASQKGTSTRLEYEHSAKSLGEAFARTSLEDLSRLDV
jgi:hypothetical protein